MIDKSMALIILLLSVFLSVRRASAPPFYRLLADTLLIRFFVAGLDPRGLVCLPMNFIEAVVKHLLFEKLQRLLAIDIYSTSSGSTEKPSGLSRSSRAVDEHDFSDSPVSLPLPSSLPSSLRQFILYYFISHLCVNVHVILIQMLPQWL
jgi:hypothetical protein